MVRRDIMGILLGLSQHSTESAAGAPRRFCGGRDVLLLTALPLFGNSEAGYAQ
jgi:hypothetical protein